MSPRRKKRRKTSVERLVEKLRAHGYQVPKNYFFQRSYPGHWQRAAGAWVWSIHGTAGSPPYEIGSSDSVKVCLRAPGFTNGPYNEVYAKDR